MINENENTYGEIILSQLLPPQDWGLKGGKGHKNFICRANILFRIATL